MRIAGFLLSSNYCELVFSVGLHASLRYNDVGSMQINSHLGANKTMAYNSQNRIVCANGGNGGGIYNYSDAGTRLLKRASVFASVGQSPKDTELLSPGSYLTLEQKNHTAGSTIGFTNHIYLNGVRIAAMTPEGAIRYYLTDQVSSVKVTTDGQGNVSSRNEYLPYGDILAQEGQMNIAPKFNSQEKDEESGLDFFNARHYDSDIAQFVSADTIIDGESSSQGWNRYTYTHGNPVKYGDPSGNIIYADMGDMGETSFVTEALEAIGKTFIGKGIKEPFDGSALDLSPQNSLNFFNMKDYSKKLNEAGIDPSTRRASPENTRGRTTNINGTLHIFLDLENIKKSKMGVDVIIVHELQHAFNLRNGAQSADHREEEYQAYLASAVYAAEQGVFVTNDSSPYEPIKNTLAHNDVPKDRSSVAAMIEKRFNCGTLRNLRNWERIESEKGFKSGADGITPFNPWHIYADAVAGNSPKSPISGSPVPKDRDESKTKPKAHYSKYPSY
jgi:RHS repeat-associated protein